MAGSATDQEQGQQDQPDIWNLEFHEAADLFPMLEGDAYEDFKADIAARGQQKPIALCRGKLLDGKIRYRACKELGIIPLTENIAGDIDPVDYVLSMNLHRAHHTAEPKRGALPAATAAVEKNQTKETIRVGDETYTVLFPDLVRPQTPKERASLRASIVERGIRVFPVVDENNGIIDGKNRIEIASELGKAGVLVETRSGLTDEEKRDLAFTLNIDRRHLTPEEQQQLRQKRVDRVAEARVNGESTRAIAEKEGISQPQVLQDMKTATDKGLSVEPKGGQVKGKDGKKRKAHKTIPMPPGAADTNDQPEIHSIFEVQQQQLWAKRVVPLGEAARRVQDGIKRLADSRTPADRQAAMTSLQKRIKSLSRKTTTCRHYC